MRRGAPKLFEHVTDRASHLCGCLLLGPTMHSTATHGFSRQRCAFASLLTLLPETAVGFYPACLRVTFRCAERPYSQKKGGNSRSFCKVERTSFHSVVRSTCSVDRAWSHVWPTPAVAKSHLGPRDSQFLPVSVHRPTRVPSTRQRGGLMSAISWTEARQVEPRHDGFRVEL